MLSDKPDFIKNNTYINDLYKYMKERDANAEEPVATYKILHFTDLHIDFDYAPGSNANCNQPLCCRKENGYPSDPKDQAGFWGNYNCDLPELVTFYMMEYAKYIVEPDYIVWTGDNVAHDLWDQDEHKNALATTKFT